MKGSVLRSSVLLVLPLAVISTCGDAGVYFKVVNRTDQPLHVWGFYENCEESPGYRQDYFHDVLVPPGDTFNYSYDSPGPPEDVECVQVADSRRRLVLSEPYEWNSTYEVNNATPILDEPLPPVDQLPSQSWPARLAEEAREQPAGFALGLAFIALVAAVFLIMLPYGIFRAVRDVRSYGRSKNT
jgi:hypothetical protein